MKILMTGAHFTPAQAVIEELKKFPEVEIVYIGRKYTLEGDQSLSVESQVLPKLGVRFIPISAGRIRRVLEFKTLISLLKIPIGFLQSFYILVKESPDVVLSFGGYIGVPVVISAWLLNIPVLVHEQTLISGLANRVSNLFAKKIAVSFDKEYSFSKDKIILTGNPIRKELTTSENLASVEVKKFINTNPKLPLIYITGGNQGSHIINEAVEEILDELLKKAKVIHQTGDSKFNDFEKLEKFQEKYPDKILVKKWVGVEDLNLIYQKADLAISRAGINTVLELAFFGIPTILIPLPYLYADEQNVNAKFFAKKGLAQILPQPDLTSQNLLNLINQSLKNLIKLKAQAEQSKSLASIDAAKKIGQQIMLLSESYAKS